MHSGPKKAGEEIANALDVRDREDGAAVAAEGTVGQLVDERRQQVRDLLAGPPATHEERLGCNSIDILDGLNLHLNAHLNHRPIRRLLNHH